MSAPSSKAIDPGITPILPGSTVGVLGSGQLGRMFAIAARRMGYRVHTYSPDYDTPTGQVADKEFQGDYDDLDRVREFARNVDVVTFEFENVSAQATATAGEFVPVRPSGEVLHITQHRLREKTFLSEHGFPVTPYRVVRSIEDLRAAVATLGTPCVLKSAGFGYDGKGQVKIPAHATSNIIDEAWAICQTAVGRDPRLGRAPVECVLEAFVDFACELSIVAARSADGGFAHYGAVENAHVNHILDVTTAPATVAPEVHAEAERIARGILDQLQVVGVLCVEFFLTKSGKLLVNELAPRPHNSGHFSFDACLTSQFEQQLRAICGLPLGSPELLRPAAMANILGDLWFPALPGTGLSVPAAGPSSSASPTMPQGSGQTGLSPSPAIAPPSGQPASSLSRASAHPIEPNWQAVLAMPDIKLHLYGKLSPRPGRKMGHLTALAPTPQEAATRVRQARAMLTSR